MRPVGVARIEVAIHDVDACVVGEDVDLALARAVVEADVGREDVGRLASPPARERAPQPPEERGRGPSVVVEAEEADENRPGGRPCERPERLDSKLVRAEMGKTPPAGQRTVERGERLELDAALTPCSVELREIFVAGAVYRNA